MRDAIDSLDAYLRVESDEAEKAVALKALTQLQALLATDQKQRDQAVGAGRAPASYGGSRVASGSPRAATRELRETAT